MILNISCGKLKLKCCKKKSDLFFFNEKSYIFCIKVRFSQVKYLSNHLLSLGFIRYRDMNLQKIKNKKTTKIKKKKKERVRFFFLISPDQDKGKQKLVGYGFPTKLGKNETHKIALMIAKFRKCSALHLSNSNKVIILFPPQMQISKSLDI